jgi:hypothetical protein
MIGTEFLLVVVAACLMIQALVNTVLLVVVIERAAGKINTSLSPPAKAVPAKEAK